MMIICHFLTVMNSHNIFVIQIRIKWKWMIQSFNFNLIPVRVMKDLLDHQDLLALRWVPAGWNVVLK